jgi:integrase
MVRNTLKGIRRTLGTAPAQKSAALTADIVAMVETLEHRTTIAVHDRALILLGFAGAFRRSQLVALDVEDCAFGKDGLTVTLRRSKMDQEGVGRRIGIPYGSNPETFPVRTTQVWIEQQEYRVGRCFARSIAMGTFNREG